MMICVRQDRIVAEGFPSLSPMNVHTSSLIYRIRVYWYTGSRIRPYRYTGFIDFKFEEVVDSVRLDQQGRGQVYSLLVSISQ